MDIHDPGRKDLVHPLLGQSLAVLTSRTLHGMNYEIMGYTLDKGQRRFLTGVS